MTDLDRDELLATLARLSDADDATAAEAGRAAAAMVAEAGLGWADVIVAPETLVEAEMTATPGVAAGPTAPFDSATNSADALVLIEHLLARESLYEGTRDELLAYKEDIASGEFGDDDMVYINALYARVVLGQVRKGD